MKLSEVTVAASFTQNSVYAVATTSCLVCEANYNNGAIVGDAGCFEGTGDVVDAAPESLGCFTLKHLTKKDGKVIDHYIFFQTIQKTISPRMAGIVFYHPKLGEKRKKILEEAFK